MIKLVYNLLNDHIYRRYNIKREIVRNYEIVKFKINGGFKCPKCKKTSFFDSIKISHNELHMKTFLFHIHNFNMPGLCIDCQIELIKEYEEEIFDPENTLHYVPHICDWCGTEDAPVISGVSGVKDVITFTFGQQWWNGFYICPDCLYEGLTIGKDHLGSDFMAYDNETKKMRSTNRLGLFYKND